MFLPVLDSHNKRLWLVLCSEISNPWKLHPSLDVQIFFGLLIQLSSHDQSRINYVALYHLKFRKISFMISYWCLSYKIPFCIGAQGLSTIGQFSCHLVVEQTWCTCEYLETFPWHLLSHFAPILTGSEVDETIPLALYHD